MLGYKQKEDNENFVRTWGNIKTIVPRSHIDDLIERTVHKMRGRLAGYRYGLAWSGGKDSVVVHYLLQRVGGRFPSCIGMTKGLEYPAFMKFVTLNMPEDLKVYMSKHDLDWLQEHLDWLFPTTKVAKKWFKAVQHSAQDRFFKEQDLQILVTGRRRKDYNHCGPKGEDIYKNKRTGVVRYSPIADWTHEETLACMAYYNLPLAPFYGWPNGWVVGSGCWAARQWCGSIQNGWKEVYSIDPMVVKKAAEYIPSALHFLKSIE